MLLLYIFKQIKILPIYKYSVSKLSRNLFPTRPKDKTIFTILSLALAALGAKHKKTTIFHIFYIFTSLT